MLVGRVDPVAEQRHAVALGELSGALEEGEPLVDVAAVGAADAGDVRGDRRVPRRLDLRGHRECAIGGLDGVVEAAVDHEPTGERRERGGAEVARPGVAAGVEGGERLFEHGDGPALADVREVEPLVAQQPRVVRVVARALGQRRLDERETALALARVAEVRGRAAHELELGHARGRLGIGHDVPQAERSLAELGGRRVRGGGTSFAHRLHRRGERPSRIVGAEPVVGDLGGEAPGARGGRRLVGLGVPGVEPGAFAREEVVEDRLAHERVPERVVVALDREHAEVDALACGGVELVVGAAVHLREHRVGDADAPGGDEAQELLRRLGQAFVAGEQQLAERVGHEALVAASVDADQLLDEEGNAVAAAEHRVEHPRARSLVDDHRLRELAHLAAGEPAELAALDPPVALGLGEEVAHRMPPRDVFGAIAQHREHAARAERAHEEAEQCEARRVDPVQVFDDEDDGPLAGERLEEHRDRLVQLAGRGAGGGLGAGAVPAVSVPDAASSGRSATSAARPGPTASSTRSAPTSATSVRSAVLTGA